MDTQIGEVLTSARSVACLLPQNPRLDLVASALSLAGSLGKSGKAAQVICPTPMTVEFSRLVGVDKVSDRLGDKNLIIRFAGYDAQGIDTVTYNVDNNQFELVVVTKDGFTPPAPRQIQFSYGGISSEVVFLIGVTERKQLGKLDKDEVFRVPKIIFVGNTQVPSGLPITDSLVDPQAASCSEIIARFLEEQKLTLDQDIASNLLYGVESATDNFLSAATTAGSFEAAAVCLRNGAIRQSQQLRAARAGGVGQWRRPRDEGRPPVQPQPMVQPQKEESQPPKPQVQPAVSVSKPQPPSPEWLEPKIYTGRTVV